MTVNIESLTPETKLRRKAAAEALTAAGFPVSETSLSTMATRGGGPPYRKFGRIPLYEWGAALEWARGRLSKPVKSTSELDGWGAGPSEAA